MVTPPVSALMLHESVLHAGSVPVVVVAGGVMLTVVAAVTVYPPPVHVNTGMAVSVVEVNAVSVVAAEYALPFQYLIWPFRFTTESAPGWLVPRWTITESEYELIWTMPVPPGIHGPAPTSICGGRARDAPADVHPAPLIGVQPTAGAIPG
jgi:hypothetical protein